MMQGPGPLFPFTRALSLAMGAVLCFGMLVPLALQRGNHVLAASIIAIYLAYVVVNGVMWWRLRTRKP
ncbi:MAG TPA: hypothetical protein VMV73_06105 [Candidatus Dormibacteraeota bacterium]|nr:hypothetical protein [Candidatus Dormibacteraeota bacterium]